MNRLVLKTDRVTRVIEDAVPVTLVKDVSIDIHAGEFVSITGASGSGKSSLLYLLGLLDSPTSGEVYLNGEPTARLSSEQKARLRLDQIGFVFQFHFLLPEFTVLENITLPMFKLGRYSEKEINHRATRLLQELGMDSQIKKRPDQLSGGQRQRVAIARAMANDPQVILADEPTGNLDTKNAAIVFDIFERLSREAGKTIVAVTHDAALASRTHRKIHTVDGKVVP